MAKKIVFIVLLFGFFLVSALIIFQKSFSVFFFQDDYFLFSISRITNLQDLIKIFIPRTDAIYYRPVSLQLFYYVFHVIFGFKIFYYHLFQFILHAINGVLIFILTEKIVKKRRIALLSSFFYATSWLHFYELTWVAVTFNSIGLFFILLYFLFYLINNKVHFLAEISLVFALLSIEIATIAPLLLLVILIFWRKIVRKDIVRITIHLFFVALYFLLRFVFFKIPTTNSYQLGISIQAIKNLAIYVLWLFNFPEASIVHLRPNSFLLTATDSWFAETFPVFSILLTSALIYYVFYLIYAGLSIHKKILKPALFCLLWFIISVLPFIVLPRRAYPYYLILAQIGFWIFLSYLLTLSKSKLLSFFFCLLFITTDMFTVDFNNINHWVHMSSSHAATYYQKYQKVLPVLKDKKNIFWQIDDIFARNALVNGLGFNVFGNNYHQKYFLEQSTIPANLRLTTFDLHFYLAKERSKRLHKYFLLNIATPSAALDLWY